MFVIQPPARRVALAVGSTILVAVLGSAGPASASPSPPAPTIAYVRDFDAVTPISIFNRTAETAIPIPGYSNSQTNTPDGIAITPNGKTAYVSSEDTTGSVDTVTPVDLQTLTVEPAITVGQYPSEIAITPNGATAYVVDSGAGPNGAVTPITVATNTTKAAIPVTAAAGPIAVSPNGKTVWVASTPPGSTYPPSIYLTPISVATNTAGSRFKVGRGLPEGMTITPNGKTLYLTNYFGTVIHVTLATHAVGTPITVGGDPVGIGINPAGTIVDVVDTANALLIPINTATNAAGAGTPVGLDPFGLAWGPAGKTVWVTNFNAAAGVGGTLIPVTGTRVGSGIAAGTAPDSVAITPDQPPVAAFTAAPARHGDPTSFDSRGSYPQSTAIATYAWNFGDGKTATTTQPLVSHSYANPGTYVVTLTLTDAAGTSTTQVFTGQTVLRNGSAIARRTKKISIT
jgi:DNA-binding beta-propeller fold protein YncE